MKTNIALIGFMGAGKTSIGKALARRLDMKFIETDSLIEKKAGRSITEIFNEDGEPAFRRLEMEVVRDIAEEKNAVVACGGGIILNKINMDRLRQNAVIVYLEIKPEIILSRLLNSGDNRPLLNTPDREQRIRELLHRRQPLYEREADIKITINRADTDSAELIIEELQANESIDLQK
jgi:shikimate kinase